MWHSRISPVRRFCVQNLEPKKGRAYRFPSIYHQFTHAVCGATSAHRSRVLDKIVGMCQKVKMSTGKWNAPGSLGYSRVAARWMMHTLASLINECKRKRFTFVWNAWQDGVCVCVCDCKRPKFTTGGSAKLASNAADCPLLAIGSCWNKMCCDPGDKRP